METEQRENGDLTFRDARSEKKLRGRIGVVVAVVLQQIVRLRGELWVDFAIPVLENILLDKTSGNGLRYFIEDCSRLRQLKSSAEVFTRLFLLYVRSFLKFGMPPRRTSWERHSKCM